MLFWHVLTRKCSFAMRRRKAVDGGHGDGYVHYSWQREILFGHEARSKSVHMVAESGHVTLKVSVQLCAANA